MNNKIRELHNILPPVGGVVRTLMESGDGTITEISPADLQGTIKNLLDSGIHQSQISISYGGFEWRWSAAIHAWDLYDPEGKLFHRIKPHDEDDEKPD